LFEYTIEDFSLTAKAYACWRASQRNLVECLSTFAQRIDGGCDVSCRSLGGCIICRICDRRSRGVGGVETAFNLKRAFFCRSSVFHRCSSINEWMVAVHGGGIYAALGCGEGVSGTSSDAVSGGYPFDVRAARNKKSAVGPRHRVASFPLVQALTPFSRSIRISIHIALGHFFQKSYTVVVSFSLINTSRSSGVIAPRPIAKKETRLPPRYA
jgi:hypothetical protein